MIFQYPYHTPGYQEGIQIHNPGQGGPSGNMAVLSAHANPWPYMVGHINGMIQGPMRVIGRPQMPVNNQVSVAGTYLEMSGLIKAPTYG